MPKKKAEPAHLAAARAKRRAPSMLIITAARLDREAAHLNALASFLRLLDTQPGAFTEEQRAELRRAGWTDT